MKKSFFALFAAAVLALAVPISAADAPAAVLFPAAFSVEHQLVQTDPDGDTFRAQPVVDTYGGSTLVSVRPGGSRVIVDFARRTVTEVSVEKSTYWTLTVQVFFCPVVPPDSEPEPVSVEPETPPLNSGANFQTFLASPMPGILPASS